MAVSHLCSGAVTVRELTVPGAWEVTPDVHEDGRGTFFELYRRAELLEALGHPLDLGQANCSVSARGVLRGVHFADVPPGQAKYVSCVAGSVLDLVVDLRVGSPTFGTIDTVTLDTHARRSVYLPEGVGHAFLALEERSTVVYLCSTSYAPGREHGINPLDPGLGLPLPDDLTPILSDKDRAAPTLAEALERGVLPDHDTCTTYVASLRAAHRRTEVAS